MLTSEFGGGSPDGKLASFSNTPLVQSKLGRPRLRWRPTGRDCAAFGSLGVFGVRRLEYLQHFSPGQHPAFEDFAVSALGALVAEALSSPSPA